MASNLEEILCFQLKALGLSFVREHRVVPTRRFRFDVAFPDALLAVEIQGGTWINGGHSRGKGIERDCEKAAEAMILGWRVLHVTTDQVRTGQALQWIQKLLDPTLSIGESPYRKR